MIPEGQTVTDCDDGTCGVCRRCARRPTPGEVRRLRLLLRLPGSAHEDVHQALEDFIANRAGLSAPAQTPTPSGLPSRGQLVALFEEVQYFDGDERFTYAADHPTRKLASQQYATAKRALDDGLDRLYAALAARPTDAPEIRCAESFSLKGKTAVEAGLAHAAGTELEADTAASSGAPSRE